MAGRVGFMLSFNVKYFKYNLLLLFIIVLIASVVTDQFIRPFVGDALIVIWMYLFVKSFVAIKSTLLAHSVLIFSYTIECAQYFNLVRFLNLQDAPLARIIIGSTFDWLDFVAYTVGWLLILAARLLLLKD